MTRHALVVVVLAAWIPAGSVAQPSRDGLGAEMRIELVNGPRITAELLAVSADSVFLAGPAGYRAIPLGELASARVPVSGLTGRDVALWALVGGTLSGLGMTVACSSLDDTGCGGVFLGVAVTWAIFGGVSALMNGPSTRPVTLDAATLSRYARFPQGMPDNFAIVAPAQPRAPGRNR